MLRLLELPKSPTERLASRREGSSPKNSLHPHASALLIDWMLSEGQKVLVEKFGRNSTGPALKHLFPELVSSKYLAVSPEKFGSSYTETMRSYYEIFRHCQLRGASGKT